MSYYLIIGGIILFVVFVFLCYRKKSFVKELAEGGMGDEKSMTMRRLSEDETPNGKRVIMATQMSKAEVENAIEGFTKLNTEDGSSVVKPLVRQVDGDTFLMSFPNSTDYALFCYWVNYFVYSNKDKKYNSNVTGWYEVAAEAKGLWEPFAKQKLMFYVPESDTEYDNVYFTTETNVCYKQKFTGKASLIQQNTVYKTYVDMP